MNSVGASSVKASDINACLTMQIATTDENQPWICSVYFVIQGGKFYWLSFPERRHSKELASNTNAAVAIVLQAAQPVVGVQAEGTVAVVTDVTEAQEVLDRYGTKYNQGRTFMQHLKSGTNKHQLYCFTPGRIVIFDERDTRQRDEPQAEAVIV